MVFDRKEESGMEMHTTILFTLKYFGYALNLSLIMIYVFIYLSLFLIFTEFLLCTTF